MKVTATSTSIEPLARDTTAFGPDKQPSACERPTGAPASRRAGTMGFGPSARQPAGCVEPTSRPSSSPAGGEGR